MATEMGEAGPRLPRLDTSGDAGAAAAQVRQALPVPNGAHPPWVSASAAFDAWRESVESLGVAVFLFQLGPENCRGFSLWNDTVPVIAVNTAWNDEARTFTLLHELGHLVARTDSACAAGERSYAYDDLLKRDKLSLDLFWLKDKSLTDMDSLPSPDVLATEIADDLATALEQFTKIAARLSRPV